MKRNLWYGIGIVFVLTFISTQSHGQSSNFNQSRTSFIGYYIGAASVYEGVFPGTSLLFGQRFISKNNIVFEYEAGLAFPSILTGKIGVGRQFKNTALLLGVRPFPSNLFLQADFRHSNKGYWNVSLEYNPLDYRETISFDSKGLLNIGYRWNLSIP